MKIKICIICLMLLITNIGYANDKIYDDISNVTFVRNYDGDTITVNIDNYPDIIGKDISVRIYGIDAPEINGECDNEVEFAKIVKSFIYSKLIVAKSIKLVNVRRDKYFRILADVEYDGKNLSIELLNTFKINRYYGGKKELNYCN